MISRLARGSRLAGPYTGAPESAKKRVPTPHLELALESPLLGGLLLLDMLQAGAGDPGPPCDLMIVTLRRGGDDREGLAPTEPPQ